MDQLKDLFKQKYGFGVEKIEKMKDEGSDRMVYRIQAEKLDKSIIGVVGKNIKENEAFLGFSEYFGKIGLPVPQILAVSSDKVRYLEEDLGNDTLFSWMNKIRDEKGFSEEIVDMYKRVIDWLPKFQIEGARELDFSLCYQHIEFGRESMMWDLHYCKQNFLNNFCKAKIDNQGLERDFNRLVEFLLTEKGDYFLYRDFQSRNIMIKDDKPYFIDYQSGRKGALEYDLASLLYDAKANIPQNIREELVEYYLEKLPIKVNKNKFKQYFYGFALIRIMQALGAYGFLGFVKGKKQFLASIPFAINNLEIILGKKTILDDLPTLREIFNNLTSNGELRSFSPSTSKELTIKIYSFGYHFSGIPQDDNARHNGGFVFDLRCLPNPGREERFRNLTGLDKEVIEYLDNNHTAQEYLEYVIKIIDLAIENYKNRNFTELMISFGCTGGEHRSVYFAEKLKKYLMDKEIEVVVEHVDL